VNIHGGGNFFMQTFGISTSSLFMDDASTTQIVGGTIRIFPPSFANHELIIIGKLQLPISSVVQKFDVGINLPTTTTNVYTPLSILSNSGTTTAKVNLSTFDDIPTGYYAPNVKWTVETAATDANIIFTWQSSIESSLFTARRAFAKVFYFNGTLG
jgi:hypothetical protein